MKLLIIARYFPPKQGAQQIQMWKVANALANEGIKTIVISQFATTGKQIGSEKYVLHENCSLKVFYVPGTIYLSDSKKYLARLKVRLRGEIEAINNYSQWTKGACSLAENIIKCVKPDAILTVSTPFESHLVGLNLRKKFNIPWLAFFSDPWPKNPHPYNTSEIVFFSEYKLSILKRCFKHCDAILATNKFQIKYMQESSGINISDHSYIIPHIGDECYIERNTNLRNVLTHTGFLSKERISQALLTAIKLNVENAQIDFGGLVQVGNVSSQFIKLINENNLMNYVKFLGVVPPKEANVLAYHSKALLVIEADMVESPYLPSKFADYAMSRRPILALTPKKSAIRDFLEEYGGGIAVTHNDVEIDTALKRIFLHNETFDSSRLAEQFTASKVAKKYLEIIQNVMRSKNS